MNTLPEQLQLCHHWLREGNIELAKVLLLDINRQHPLFAPAIELLAQVWSHQNQPLQAIGLLKTITGKDTCPASAILLLGDLYLEQGNPKAAIQHYQLALKTNEPFFDVLHNLGLAYAQLFLFREAVDSFEKASQYNSLSLELQINWGAALKNLGRLQESLEHLLLAEKMEPLNPAIWLNKGVTFEALNQQVQAIESYKVAIDLQPTYLEAHCNLANSLMLTRKFDQALVHFEKALTLAPNDPDTLFNLSHLQLSHSDFINGWKNAENRWLCQNALRKPFQHIPELKSLANIELKKILVWSEQGLGDSIQFCRLLPTLIEKGAEITFITQNPLIEVFRTLKGLENIFPLSQDIDGSFEFQISLMSLPLLFVESGIHAPDTNPYLGCNPEKAAYWKKRLQNLRKLKVGLVWSGGFRENKPESWPVNAKRNIPFKLFAELQDISGIQFFSLQKGNPAEQELLQERASIWPSENLSIITSELHSFEDTAALINNLDLVISVDTSTAHLAGALGKPIWMLNRYDSCWRWLIGQEDTHWYPTMRIFNQPSSGDWASVLASVKSELLKLTNTPI